MKAIALRCECEKCGKQYHESWPGCPYCQAWLLGSETPAEIVERLAEVQQRTDDIYRAKFERLGAAGEAYFQELRGQNAALVAQLTASQTEAARLRDLLKEFVADEKAGYHWWAVDEANCGYCDMPVSRMEYPHTSDCLVTRARDALDRIAKP